MSNENIRNTALSESIALLEQNLDTMLAEQRKAAHNAIDMDDWSKAEEILARSKTNIVRIEGLKNKFNEFKNEAIRLEFITADGSSSETASSPAASEQPKPDEQTAPSPKPETQPAAAKPAKQPAPSSKSEAQPAAAKPADQPAPNPKPEAQPTAAKPASQPAPSHKPEAQPVVAKPQPKPVPPKPAPKPAEPAKPAPAPAPKPAEQTTRLDFEMDDIEEPKTDPNNPIIIACEELITRFPFSMKLISKNEKIGKFFKDDEATAKKDLSKPAQLSSGLWVETNVPEDRLQVFIRSIKRYCDESVNA